VVNHWQKRLDRPFFRHFSRINAMFRLSLRELFLVSVIAAVAAAWWRDHRQMVHTNNLDIRERETATALLRHLKNREAQLTAESKTWESLLRFRENELRDARRSSNGRDQH